MRFIRRVSSCKRIFKVLIFQCYLILIIVQINVNCTNYYELEVQKIIHSQGIINQLPYVLIYSKQIVKSHILAANTPTQIYVLVGQFVNIAANESKPHLKRGRPISAKDKIFRKIKVQEKNVVAPNEAVNMK